MVKTSLVGKSAGATAFNESRVARTGFVVTSQFRHSMFRSNPKLNNLQPYKLLLKDELLATKKICWSVSSLRLPAESDFGVEPEVRPTSGLAVRLALPAGPHAAPYNFVRKQVSHKKRFTGYTKQI